MRLLWQPYTSRVELLRLLRPFSSKEVKQSQELPGRVPGSDLSLLSRLTSSPLLRILQT
jgi:hypothetical protein